MRDAVEAISAMRVVAYQIVQEMRRADVSQSEIARRMHTSRTSVTRLIDADNPVVTLSTLERAAGALCKRFGVRFTT